MIISERAHSANSYQDQEGTESLCVPLVMCYSETTRRVPFLEMFKARMNGALGTLI